MAHLDLEILGDTRLWNTLVNWIFCTGMAGCFLVWAVAYLLPVRRIGRALQRMAAEPFWLEETTALDSRRLRAAELVRRSGDARTERAFNLFKNQWSRHATRVRGEQVSTIDIAEVMPEESLLPERFATWFAPSIPGFFTGTGILGTFVGLVLGLVGVGFGGSLETGGGQFFGNVLSMLSGMYTAFLTSIVGITLSLTWIALDGSMRGRLAQELDRFHQAVKAVYPVRTSADLMLSLVESSTRMQQDMAVLGSNLSEQQTERLGVLAGHFLQRLEEASGGHFDAVRQALEGVSRQYAELHDSLEQLRSGASSASGAIREIVESAGEVQRQLQLSSTGIENADRVHRDAVERLGRIVDDFAAQLGAAQEELSRGSLSIYEREMGRVSKQLTAMLEQTRNAMGELEQVLRRVNQRKEGSGVDRPVVGDGVWRARGYGDTRT